MRFFADHCVSLQLIKQLRDQGHEVIRIIEQLPCDAPDAAVIAKARDLKAILISLNGDFVDIVTYPPQHYLGIIALQLRNHPESYPFLLTTLAHYLTAHSDQDHYQGRLFVVGINGIRIRS